MEIIQNVIISMESLFELSLSLDATVLKLIRERPDISL